MIPIKDLDDLDTLCSELSNIGATFTMTNDRLLDYTIYIRGSVYNVSFSGNSPSECIQKLVQNLESIKEEATTIV